MTKGVLVAVAFSVVAAGIVKAFLVVSLLCWFAPAVPSGCDTTWVQIYIPSLGVYSDLWGLQSSGRVGCGIQTKKLQQGNRLPAHVASV